MEHRETRDREGMRALARERRFPAVSPGQVGMPICVRPRRRFCVREQWTSLTLAEPLACVRVQRNRGKVGEPLIWELPA